MIPKFHRRDFASPLILVALAGTGAGQAPISDLQAAAVGSTEVELTWTAPTDPFADLYELRFSTAGPIDESIWSLATKAANFYVTQLGGPDSYRLGGLTAQLQYWFAIKYDDWATHQWGPVSNSATANLDFIPPDPISTLRVASTAPGTATLEWAATGDDGLEGTAASCELRYSTSPLETSSFPTAALAGPGVPAPEPAGISQTAVIRVPSAGGRFYFAIKAIDENGNPSAMSNVADDVVPPASEDGQGGGGSGRCGGSISASDGAAGSVLLAAVAVLGWSARNRNLTREWRRR